VSEIYIYIYKRKKREKKRGYIYKKKGTEKGREWEWASWLYIHQRLFCVHTFKLWHYTSAEKHFTAYSTQPYSRALAKPCHNSHPLLALHSVVSSPTHAKKRNAPLTIQGFATQPRVAHAYMQRKETYFAPPIPKHCAQRSCHLGPRFLHTSRVCNLAFLFTCVNMVPSSVSFCIRQRSPRQPYAIMPLLQQLQDIHSYTLLVSTLRYMPR